MFQVYQLGFLSTKDGGNSIQFRFVDHASGWIDQDGPDFKSMHIYRRPIEFKPAKLNRPIVLSEFGGYGRIIDNHIADENYFYYKIFYDNDSLTEAIKILFINEVLPNIKKRTVCFNLYSSIRY